ncbi:acyltransferase family protein [Bradyrhizobium erythrophlei]|uniref:Peptidoglycan/LPS O-acetylase OafA/YrhL, contains acyltransferase and SGNH-hydrolase domains n=1 Tax=Bradyrhizobium erythrophlei TaxID=1437360 RepID=A0A1H5EK24_9BRAD|nr:acyltransferase [Bradyrhizobium erythrophlei]SED91455.1 Peptidoglycan/LPS O-acetylase OafA/YrhL, contains acyltransferase and SGNH-hydrolase domains [Bradyrhizobium erythrophlei]
MPGKHIMKSIGEILDENDGVGRGFDFLRIGLALAVVAIHSVQVCYGPEAPGLVARGMVGPFLASVLPMFFGLSGFLVMGSSFRTRNVATFLTFRALRLIPALAVEVTLSALILGTVLTTLPLAEYFSDIRLLAYFGNIIGRVRFELPGVFDDLPASGMVNANLWTLHAELFCYFLMTAAMLTRVAYNRVAVTAVWGAMAIFMTGYGVYSHAFELHGGAFKSSVLVFSFVSGVVAYHWRHSIPASNWIALISVPLAFGLLKLPYTAFAVHLPIIYLTLWIGSKPLLSLGGDYSYGVYLYSYPIQQTLVSLSPSLREWWVIFPLATIMSVLIASLSWTYIERPALQLKRLIVRRQPKSQRVSPVLAPGGSDLDGLSKPL